jgi:hypothetical protein
MPEKNESNIGTVERLKDELKSLMQEQVKKIGEISPSDPFYFTELFDLHLNLDKLFKVFQHLEFGTPATLEETKSLLEDAINNQKKKVESENL